MRCEHSSAVDNVVAQHSGVTSKSCICAGASTLQCPSASDSNAVLQSGPCDNATKAAEPTCSTDIRDPSCSQAGFETCHSRDGPMAPGRYFEQIVTTEGSVGTTLRPCTVATKPSLACWAMHEWIAIRQAYWAGWKKWEGLPQTCRPPNKVQSQRAPSTYQGLPPEKQSPLP